MIVAGGHDADGVLTIIVGLTKADFESLAVGNMTMFDGQAATYVLGARIGVVGGATEADVMDHLRRATEGWNFLGERP